MQRRKNFLRQAWFALFTLILLSLPVASAQDSVLAPTPPMGWNSWDAYGEGVKESDIRATAEWMAQNLKSYGWQYVVIDMGWYVTNYSPGANPEKAEFNIDAYGRYLPTVTTYPSASNGAGFGPLADYVHSLGLKFGIHLLRGIPKTAVEKNLPIQGSDFHAKDAADTADTCPWNPFNYGLNSSQPAAQAYYDSLARQFAAWSVDFVKVDCISSRPYKGDEIRMLSLALRKVARPIVLSLSPGPAPIEKADELAKYAQMWRISDDEWDLWQSKENFPQGVNNQFERAAEWAVYSRPGSWPDADMLAIGWLGPTPGWGEVRWTRLTKDEQRTLLTLWSIFRSPLFMGGDLLMCDQGTQSLLTNAEIIAVDQHSAGNHAVWTTPKSAVWLAENEHGDGNYLAVFNRNNDPQTLHFKWNELGLNAAVYSLRDLWDHKDLGQKQQLDLTLAPHASALFALHAQDKP